MPDDSNLYDDDSLVPDWLRGMDSDQDSGPPGSEPSEPGWSQETPLPDWDAPAGAQPPAQAGSGATRPPWKQMPGQMPSRPVEAPPAAAPWQQFQGTGAPPSAPPPVAPPWRSAPGPSIPMPPPPAGPPAPGRDQIDSLGWQADMGTTAPQSDIPRGLTSDLPWHEETQPPAEEAESDFWPQAAPGLPEQQFTMSGLMTEFEDESPPEHTPPAAQPSLHDRIQALPPEKAPPAAAEPRAEEAEWLSAFGQAAGYDANVPSGDEVDTSWLEGRPSEEAPSPGSEPAPPAPIKRLQRLPDTEGSAPAEPQASVMPDWLDDEFADGGLPPEDAFSDEQADERDDSADWLAAEFPADDIPGDDDLTAEDDDLVPAWLGSEDAFTGDTQENDEPGTDAEADDIPDWLGDELGDETFEDEALAYDDLTPAWLDEENDEPGADVEADDIPDWVDGETFEDEAPAYDDLTPAWLDEDDDEPGADAEADDIPDWLGSETFEDEAPAYDDLPDEEEDEALPEWVQQDTTERRQGIRRIQPLGAAPAADEPEEEGLPEWVTSEAALDDDNIPEDLGGLSYEEWEQREIERQIEEQKTPEERLLEEVPEWFDRLDTEEPASPPDEKPVRPSEAEFVPDWFFGLEEQNADEAPDWFQQIDYSAEAMAELPSNPAPQNPSAGDEPPSEEDLPDWFKGIGAPDTGGADWAAAFGAPADEQPAGETEPDELPLPDMDTLTGDMEQPIEAGEVPDWLAAAAPGADEMAQPEDIPFPDMDLDEMPLAEPMAEELESWLVDSAPGEPPEGERVEELPEDFVERFEPAMPDQYPAAPIDEEAPDWLREMGAGAPEEGLPLPDDIFGPPGGQAPPAAPAAATEEELDWLADISPEDVQRPPAPEAPAEAAPMPAQELDEDTAFDSRAIDELLSLYTPEEVIREEEAEPEAEPEAVPEEVLTDFEDGLEEITGVLIEPPAEAGEEAELEPAIDLDMLFAEAEAEGFEPGEFEAPDLDDLFAEAAPETEPPAMLEDEFEAADFERFAVQPIPASSQPPAGEKAEVEEDEIPLAAEEPQPEWLSEMRPADLPVTLTVAGVQVDVPQKQVAELPDRLQTFHDAAIREARETPAPQPAPESGPLAGIEGALQPLEDTVIEETVTLPTGLIITRQQQRRVEKLQAILEMTGEEEVEEAAELPEPGRFDFEEGEPEEAAERAPAPRRRRQRRFKPDRLVISLVLLIGLVAPFATDALHFADDPPALSGERQDAVDTVDAVGAGDYVLFAFEYGPTAAGELDLLAEAVLRDVLARGAIPLTLSTNPVTALHAEAVIAPLVDDKKLLAVRGAGEETLKAGEDYVVLSFLPGGAVGVRSLQNTTEDNGALKQHPAFGHNIRGEEIDLPIKDVNADIALIVVIGETTEDVRTWAEQLEDIDQPGKIALVTAAAEPVTVPYVNEDAYDGYLAGYRDMVRYNADRNTDSREPYTVPDDISFDIPNPEESRWHSMALGAALAAGLITLGMVVNLFRVFLRRRRR